MEDLRCRYYHKIYVDDQLVFAGYLLHEEGWILSQTLPYQKSVRIAYEKSNTASKSDACPLLPNKNVPTKK